MHQFGGPLAKGTTFESLLRYAIHMGVFGKEKFENQQCRLIEVCDCSSEQQRALCVNLEKEGRGFGFNNHVGLEEGGYYQVSSMSMHWFGAR